MITRKVTQQNAVWTLAAGFQRSTALFTLLTLSHTGVNIKMIHSHIGVLEMTTGDVRNFTESDLLLQPYSGPAVQKDKNM